MLCAIVAFDGHIVGVVVSAVALLELLFCVAVVSLAVVVVFVVLHWLAFVVWLGVVIAFVLLFVFVGWHLSHFGCGCSLVSLLFGCQCRFVFVDIVIFVMRLLLFLLAVWCRCLC